MKISKSYTKGMVVLQSISLLIALFGCVAFVKISSEDFIYNESEGSRLVVSGFTNPNSWRMETQKINCSANFEISKGKLKNINALTFSTPIESLISNHPHMDSVVYHMLSANGAKEITFVQKKQMVLERMKMVNIIGELTIGKETRVIDIQLSFDIVNDQQINFKGLKKLALHNFGVNKLNPILKKLKFDDQVMVEIEMNLNNKYKANIIKK